MWVFTKYGFFSAVCAGREDDRDVADPGRMMLRARQREHLEALQERFPAETGAAEILAGVGTDYPFRIFIDKAAWASVSESLAAEIDYRNFKNEAHSWQGATPYLRALSKVWGTMWDLEHDQGSARRA